MYFCVYNEGDNDRISKQLNRSVYLLKALIAAEEFISLQGLVSGTRETDRSQYN